MSDLKVANRLLAREKEWMRWSARGWTLASPPVPLPKPVVGWMVFVVMLVDVTVALDFDMGVCEPAITGDGLEACRDSDVPASHAVAAMRRTVIITSFFIWSTRAVHHSRPAYDTSQAVIRSHCRKIGCA